MAQNQGYEYFMKIDLSPYIGEWIAICDDKIVAHKQSFKEAYAVSKRVCPNHRPFVTRVPTKEAMVL